MQDEIKKIIEYRINQANQVINEVELLIQNQFYVLAVNRIYYGMFYILLALSLKHGFKTSKHSSLIGWFNKEFVKTREVDKNMTKFSYSTF